MAKEQKNTVISIFAPQYARRSTENKTSFLN
jgi:hypothetical protein